ncbi:hypothetical protein COU61_02835 [Candidatus Pacearchaeota archaeon CG10_big_fil_rev_8_21_14_0_10_35_13]|nr:MAG: hypothetical protein COU61_02835 [Candidatus Pacearchaeota archaeon CG10_big_fil_rev_8_21_14_0_10_35_13]
MLKTLGSVPDKSLHITYSIQYHSLALEVKKFLEDEGFAISKFFQVLGCRRLNIPKLPVLHVGTGEFHATNPNILELTDKIILFDGHNITSIPQEVISDYKKSIDTKIKRYSNSKSVGLLISVKPGQHDINNALRFSEENHDKKFYHFLTNNVNPSEFENFNTVDFWVNTACPRIEDDSPNIISLERLNQTNKK